MIESLQLYGFGSFFSDSFGERSDIDLMIVHESIDSHSSNHAIALKRIVQSIDSRFDVSILSASELVALNWVQKANAKLLGNVSSDTMNQAGLAIVHSILANE